MIYNSDKKASALCVSIIKKFEGLNLTTYRCPSNKLTIGFGHTGREVKWGQTITLAQAESYLDRDIEKAENVIKAYCNGELTQGQFDCLVDLIFNIGSGLFKQSSILKRINDRKLGEVPERILLYNKGGSPLKVLPGLVKRRKADVELWILEL